GAFRQFLTTHEDHFVTQGDPATLEARFSGTKPLKARWLKAGKELISGQRYKVHGTDTSSVLKINKTDKCDGGEYTFENFFSLLFSSVLDQIIPPSFTRKLKQTEGIKGSFAHLECLVSGSLPITIQWYKDDNEIKPDEKHKCTFFENVALLEISNLGSKDSGSYTCIAKNKAGTSLSCFFLICFVEPPKFTRTPSRLSVVRLGQSKVFECQVTGTPEIDICWFKEGTEISPSERYKMAFVNSLATLEVCGTDTKDSGLYYCEARNEAGSESCSMELKVKEPPSFTKELTPTDIGKGSSVCFECQVAGTGPLEITWHKDAKEIKPSAKHGFSEKNGTVGLEVHKCDTVDVGEYQCTVANEVGSCSCKTTLNLKEPPTFTKRIENTATVLGKMAEFQCIVAGSPTLSVQWQKDENWILEDPKIVRTFENNVATLRIPACEAVHGGKYTCQVVNEAGKDKCFAILNVQESV
uniref:Ig-like domain-containing protein n=1 Tax=Mola mola TaxID=94237 RepID=A0A3Q3XGG4_MOLML